MSAPSLSASVFASLGPGSSMDVPQVGAPAWALVVSLLLAALVVLLSMVPLGAARAQSDFSLADLAAPRAMFDRLPAWGQRANWAHQNCFEAFNLHAPACLLVLVSGPSGLIAPVLLVAAALLHPALRLVYVAAYVADIPLLRSLSWAAGLLCSGLLYSEGLVACLAR